MSENIYQRLRSGQMVNSYGKSPASVYQDRMSNWTHTIRDVKIHSTSNPRNSKGVYTSGSSFHLEKDVMWTDLQSVNKNNGGLNSSFIGCIGDLGLDFPAHQGWTVLPNKPPDDFGASAFAHARQRITNPSFDGLTELIELRELPGMLKDTAFTLANRFSDLASGRFLKQGPPSARSIAKGMGSDYLKFWFGYVPLVSSVMDLTKAYNSRSQRLTQLVRDNGRTVRRRGQLGNTSQSTYTPEGDVTTVYAPAPFLVRRMVGGTRTTLSSRTWYSGAFKYWLPPAPDPVQFNRTMMMRIFGLRITPRQLYNAMPWSWLIDYFSDVGDMVDAISPGVEDRFAASYCFVMREDKLFSARESSLYWKDNSSVMLTSFRETSRKTRVAANPFGIGGINVNLSPFQASILGALGASRL